MIRLAAVLTVLSAPAFAQGATFVLPEGCTAYLTIQKRSCSVSHHFTCAGDAEGFQRRVDLDELGMTYLGMTDSETRWVESFHPMAGRTEYLMEPETDPASFSGLISTGRDSYDFRTESSGTINRYVGEDRLTGVTVTIDGVTLEQTEYNIVAYDGSGTEVWRAAGNEFISREWNMFIGGTSAYVTSSESFEADDTPVEFIFPGEPGFQSLLPKHGCGAILSGLPAGLWEWDANGFFRDATVGAPS